MLNKIFLNKKDKLKGLKIPKESTEDLAYLSGVLAGDGSLGYRQNKNEYSLKCVGNPKDEKDFYLNIVGPKFEKVFGFIPTMKTFDKNTTFGFRIFSKSLVCYLTQTIGLPLGPKNNSLKIPSKINTNKMLLMNFVRGLFDTDGSISFKKRYKQHPYYPVISFSSRKESFTKEIAAFLKEEGFKIVEIYNYKIEDKRMKTGFTIINRIELNGNKNLSLWMTKISFSSPKHLEKIRKYGRIK